MFNPTSLTDEQLYEYVDKMIRDGYVEADNYIYVMPDMLTVGVHRFTADLILTRGWGNRLLGMLQQARQIKAHVSRMAKGKQTLHEYAISDYITDEKNKPRFRGLDASERKMAARRACSGSEDEAKRWDILDAGLRAYIEVLEERLRDIREAKYDLRAQLWAVRVHGVLGELSKEAQSDEVGPLRYAGKHDGDDVPIERVGKVKPPEMGPPAVVPPPPHEVVEHDASLDELLGVDGDNKGA